MDEFNIPEGEFNYTWRSEEWWIAYRKFKDVFDQEEFKRTRLKKYKAAGMPKHYELYVAFRRKANGVGP